MQILTPKGSYQPPLFSQPKPSKGSWRGEFIDRIVYEINQERVGTKFKPVTPRRIAVLTSHLRTGQDFSFLISTSMDCKRRTGSFGKCFFGSMKINETNRQ